MEYIPESWVLLELRFHEALLTITCRDNLHRFRRFVMGPYDLGPIDRPSELVENLGMEEDRGGQLADLIRELAVYLPHARQGPHNTGPVPLVVYMKPPHQFQQYRWESAIEAIVSRLVDPDTFQVVRLARAKWQRRNPFRLPFRVLAVGLQVVHSLDALRSKPWYQQSQHASEFGLQIAESEPATVLQALRSSVRDVLITDSLDHGIRRAVRALPLEERPRLIIVLSSEDAQPLQAPEPFCPQGVSFLWVPAPLSLGGEFLQAFLYGLIHDLPLHEALKSALRTLNAQQAGAFLVTDPQGNHDLRLLDALAELRKEGILLDATIGAPDVEGFLGRYGVQLGATVSQELRAAFAGAPQLGGRELLTNAIAGARVARAVFDEERLGLVPLAETEAMLARARNFVQQMHQTLATIASDPVLMRTLREHQRRSVDVALERLETGPLLSSVERNHSLAQRTRYQLRIHVGHRLADSLVAGAAPPLDPLLPDPESARGQMLEVAVQGKDFEVLSAQVHELYLPLIGGSEPVYFSIRTPAATPLATLRIAIYYQNHLLQSYLFEAYIALSEQYPTPNAELPRIRLEYSRTARFTNLDELGQRVLSIGTNQGQTTHELMVKTDGTAGELSLPPIAFDREMEVFRQILAEATFDRSYPTRGRIYAELPLGTPPPEEVATILRNLAREGNELYRAVFRRARQTPKLQRALQALRECADKTLQIIRFDEIFVFPWPLLYDYDLPNDPAGMPPKPVCLGVVVDSHGAAVPCSHTSTFDGYCANGFWGVRHYVEELIGQNGHAGDAVKKVVLPGGAGAIRLVVDQTVPEAVELAKRLQDKLGQGKVITGPEDETALIDLLWQKTRVRPAILIVLGHLETQIIHNKAVNPRIVLVPGSKWLTHAEISKRYGRALAWDDDPRTLVLLMACESAATSIETINDFITVLNAAGAAGVIGTECIVFSKLVAQFAEEVTLALWQPTLQGVPTPLGRAITEFRRRLLRSGNPLAFVFRAVGDADLTIEIAPGT